MMLVRWVSAVFTLTPNVTATSLHRRSHRAALRLRFSLSRAARFDVRELEPFCGREPTAEIPSATEGTRSLGCPGDRTGT